MASVPEHPTPTTSDPAPVTPFETIAARTDEMWVVEVTDPATYASIGGVLSVVEKETVDTMGPSEGNWRKGTTTSEETNLDLESTEYFECKLVPSELQLPCVTPTDWSMVGHSELTCATLIGQNYVDCLKLDSELTCATLIGQNVECLKLDCVTHTDDSDHSTISTLQESDCVTHADDPTALLETDPLDDIYYDTVSESDCVTHTDYSTSDCVTHTDYSTVLFGTDPLDDIYYDTHTTVSITPVISPSLRATFANHFIAFHDSIEVDPDLDNYHDCALSEGDIAATSKDYVVGLSTITFETMNPVPDHVSKAMLYHQDTFTDTYEFSPTGINIKGHTFYDVETTPVRVIPGIGCPDITWMRWIWNIFNIPLFFVTVIIWDSMIAMVDGKNTRHPKAYSSREEETYPAWVPFQLDGTYWQYHAPSIGSTPDQWTTSKYHSQMSYRTSRYDV